MAFPRRCKPPGQPPYTPPPIYCQLRPSDQKPTARPGALTRVHEGSRRGSCHPRQPHHRPRRSHRVSRAVKRTEASPAPFVCAGAARGAGDKTNKQQPLGIRLPPRQSVQVPGWIPGLRTGVMPDERAGLAAAGGAAATIVDVQKTGADAGEEKDKIAVSVEAAGCTLRILRRDLEEDNVDPCFFEPTYTVAGSTGFVVWEGSWMLMNYVATQMRDEIRGKKVVELGSGTGLAGLFIAAHGAHVMTTDLVSVVEECLNDNIAMNRRPPTPVGDEAPAVTGECKDALPATAPETADPGAPPIEALRLVPDACSGTPWAGATPIGLLGGTCVAQELDWVRPVREQAAPLDFADADIILAAETVWLKELIEPFVVTVVSLLSSPKRPPCYLSYHNRGTEQSVTFATTGELLDSLRAHGCAVDLITEGVPPRAGISCVMYRVTLSG